MIYVHPVVAVVALMFLWLLDNNAGDLAGMSVFSYKLLLVELT